MDEITHGSFFLNVQLCTQLLIVGLQGTKKTLKTNLTSINCFFVLATEANNRKEKVCLFISSWSILVSWLAGMTGPTGRTKPPVREKSPSRVRHCWCDIYAICCDTVIYIWCDISCNVNLTLCSSTASALRLFWLIIPFLGRTRKVEKLGKYCKILGSIGPQGRPLSVPFLYTCHRNITDKPQEYHRQAPGSAPQGLKYFHGQAKQSSAPCLCTLDTHWPGLTKICSSDFELERLSVGRQSGNK